MIQEHNWNKNQIRLHGEILEPATYSHTSHGMDYYIFPFGVTRLSGVKDQVKVLCSQELLQGLLPDSLDSVVSLTVIGEIRSFNNHHGSGRRLVITVHASSLWKEEGEDENCLSLAGTLCKPSIHRRTPLGRDICDMMLAVNRSYGRTDYLPCISWGSLAQKCGHLSVGTHVAVEGRLQSRIYTKKLSESTEERTAFEISVAELNLLEP